MANKKPILFTGIRPTGELHLANYLGAIKPAIERQEQFSGFLCIVDLHAITTPYEPKKMPEAIKGVALDYLAGGVDPEKSVLFIQSHVHEHTELMWLLNTITSVGELQRMTQFKEFKERYGEPQAGILNYPILMAADILLYKAELVPVGDDQMQHLELARTLAKKFNRLFGETFPVPKNVNKTDYLRLKALNDPLKKMSKSLGPKSYIALTDDEKTIRKKIASAVTDPGPSAQTGNNLRVTDNKKKKLDVISQKLDVSNMSPGVKNLFTLLELTADKKTFQHMTEHYNNGKLQYSELKPILADSIIDYLKPIQERRKELEKDLDYIAKILAKGAEKARGVASETLREVKQKMGLL